MKSRPAYGLFSVLVASLGAVMASCATSEAPPAPDSAGHSDAVVADTPPLPPPPKTTCPTASPTPQSAVMSLGQVDVWEDPAGIARTHILDVDRDPITGRYYAVGYGGFMAFEDTGGAPKLLGMMKPPGVTELTRLAALGDGLVAVTHRQVGLGIVDASSPWDPKMATFVDYLDASGMAVHGSVLYLLLHSGELVTLDVTNPLSPTEVHRLGGLGNPWKLAVSGDRAYVADNSQGLVVLNLDTPAAPTLGAVIPTAGSAQDVHVHGGHAFVAVGSKGLEIFSLADPEKPSAVAVIDLGGMAVAVHGDSDVMWVTNQTSVIAVDISTPSAPFVLGYQDTDEWAMHVFAIGDDAMVGAWGLMARYQVDSESVSPVADTSVDALYVAAGESEIQLDLINRGGAYLTLEALAVADPRFTPSVDDWHLGPGERVTITLAFADDGAEVNASLCLSTDAPGRPRIEIPISATKSGSSLALGSQAPDFQLDDTFGQSYQLSAQLGHPVLLVYFATW